MTNDSSFYFLRPAKPDEFLPPISRWVTVGGLLLLGTMTGAIALAAVSQYHVTVRTAATVRPAGEIRIVEAQTAGTVQSIQVKENQVVKRGDAIAFIDSSQLLTKKTQLQGNIQQNQLQIAQIAAQISATDERIAAETLAIERAIASAEADLSRNQRDYREKKTDNNRGSRSSRSQLKISRIRSAKIPRGIAKRTSCITNSQCEFKVSGSEFKGSNF